MSATVMSLSLMPEGWFDMQAQVPAGGGLVDHDFGPGRLSVARIEDSAMCSPLGANRRSCDCAICRAAGRTDRRLQASRPEKPVPRHLASSGLDMRAYTLT